MMSFLVRRALCIVFLFTLAIAHAQVPGEMAVADRGIFPGYQKGERALLAGWLQEWHAGSEPVADDVLEEKPAIERAVYQAYSAFYQPDELLADYDYVIVQTTIDVILVREDLREVYWKEAKEAHFHERLARLPRISRATYYDFRPKLHAKNRKVLYIDEEHLSHLRTFLACGVQSECTSSAPDSTGTYFPEQANDTREAQRRLEYLKSLLDIVPGHWGTGWHIVTQPFVYEVYLDIGMNTAVFECRNRYEGLRVLLERKEGRWKAINRARTWIE